MSLLLVAIAISVLWIVTFSFYLYLSRQHRQIEEDIDRLRQTLEEQERLERAA